MPRATRATLLAALFAAAAALPASPASAALAPPPAWTCDANVTGVRVPHDPGNLVATAEVDVVTAVVTCELDAALTSPPIDHAALYAGDITVVVFSSAGPACGIGALSFVPSVGRTLVMTVTGACTWPVGEPRGAVHTPNVWWATKDLFGGQYTVYGKTGTFLN